PVLVFFLHPDRRIKRWFFPNQEILENQSTRYGNLVVTRQAGQLNFYENNSLQFYTENRTDSEEAVHFPMALHENPKQVLLLSGGISGMLAEIEKYPVEKITYLENNPETYRLWKERTHSEGSRVSFVKADIRTFLKRDHTRYDVILIHLPPPSSLGINRFYTREFFQLIKEHCREGSIVCTSLPSTLNYPGQQALDARASLWKTLGLQFSYRRLLPGGRDYFLASDRPLPSGITSLLAEKGIETAYVHAGYIDDELMERRGKEQTAQFDPKVRVNSDAHPYLFSKAISHWFDFMDAGYIAWILLPVVLFLFLMLRMKPVTLGVYVGGFTAASLEVALMFAWQVFFGGLYGASALFFALFMGGLALGSHSTWSRGGEVRMKHFSLIQYSLAALSLLLPFFLNFIGKMGGFSIGAQVMLMIPVFFLSYAIGLEFQLASRLRNLSFSEISGIHYSADLIGSAFGAYLCALFLLPVLGLFCTALALTVLNVFSGTLALFVRRG
ncbi:MAG TPA: hypothetical protein PLK12_08840, partial [Prolixibacteraceae bacterium]|nr:hypothetical protein [Prolixibacteraceae bacterium]